MSCHFRSYKFLTIANGCVQAIFICSTRSVGLHRALAIIYIFKITLIKCGGLIYKTACKLSHIGSVVARHSVSPINKKIKSKPRSRCSSLDWYDQVPVFFESRSMKYNVAGRFGLQVSSNTRLVVLWSHPNRVSPLPRRSHNRGVWRSTNPPLTILLGLNAHTATRRSSFSERQQSNDTHTHTHSSGQRV